MTYLFSLGDWWDVLNTPEKVFWLIAIIFSVLFIVQFGLSLLGLDADTDVDVDADLDADHGYTLDKDFSIFSIRSVIAFFTFFGWTGVYLLSEGKGVGYTVALSALSGGIAMSIVAYMIFKFSQLEKSGTINLLHAIDQTGEVYLTIPEQLSGNGKIHVMIDGTLHEVDAQTPGAAITTGQKVKVIDLTEEDIMLVEPLPELDQPLYHSETNK
ncbi:MAG: hypothetical protein R3301_00655 [Saprospiraceae bacterium]|nr:hypothetical protein [Saprospiraceae bacterium]